MRCPRGSRAMGPTWEPRTIANQLTSRGSSPAGRGTSTIDRQVGHETRSPGEGSPSSSRGCPQLAQKKVKGAAASYGFPALTWEAPDAYIAASRFLSATRKKRLDAGRGPRDQGRFLQGEGE